MRVSDPDRPPVRGRAGPGRAARRALQDVGRRSAGARRGGAVRVGGLWEPLGGSASHRPSPGAVLRLSSGRHGQAGGAGAGRLRRF